MRHTSNTYRDGVGILVSAVTLCVLSVCPVWAQGFDSILVHADTSCYIGYKGQAIFG